MPKTEERPEIRVCQIRGCTGSGVGRVEVHGELRRSVVVCDRHERLVVTMLERQDPGAR